MRCKGSKKNLTYANFWREKVIFRCIFLLFAIYTLQMRVLYTTNPPNTMVRFDGFIQLIEDKILLYILD